MLQLTVYLLLLSIPMDLAPKDVQGLTENVRVQPNLEESLKCLLLAMVIQQEALPADHYQQLIQKDASPSSQYQQLIQVGY